MKKLLLLLGTTLFFSCTTEENTKIEKPHLNILILGNSITKCPSGGEWLGNWGMAASAPNKDYCSLIEQNSNSTVDRLSIAYWESNFNYGLDLFIIPDKKYDYIIFKVGENVNYSDSTFKEEFRQMVNYFKHKATKVIVVSTVWHEYFIDNQGNPHQVESSRDKAMKEVSLEDGYIYVDISEMIDDNSNYAYGQYTDPQIGCHPSDKGMNLIANKILEKL